MRYVMLYESADDVASKAPAHFAAHSGRIEEFLARGSIVGIGTFGDPQTQASMGIFTTREAAEEFAREDPFVLNGVVKRWEVREWNDLVAGD